MFGSSRNVRNVSRYASAPRNSTSNSRSGYGAPVEMNVGLFSVAYSVLHRQCGSACPNSPNRAGRSLARWFAHADHPVTSVLPTSGM